MSLELFIPCGDFNHTGVVRAIRKLLSAEIDCNFVNTCVRELLKNVGNQSVDRNTKICVPESGPIMRVLIFLKEVMDLLGVYIRSESIPSVVKTIEDGLSRRLHRGDLHIRGHLWHSVVTWKQVTVHVFPFRPLGVHPYFAQKLAFEELGTYWSREPALLLCSPVYHIGATVGNLRNNGSPVITHIQDWPRHPRNHVEYILAQMWTWHPLPPE